MNYNVCIVAPNGYNHSFAFWELAELIHYSLLELGHGSKLQLNAVDVNAKNIIIGCHLLDPNFINHAPKNSVILNTEQLEGNGTNWNEGIYRWVKNFEVWDYSQKNITTLKEQGIADPKHLKIGYQKELRRINFSESPDIDVLFYGSINDRRKKILDQLASEGLRVKAVFGIYGQERDHLVARSKIVLNHHFYESEIFEVVRVFYLLINSAAVVGEVNEKTSISDLYKKAIWHAPYNDLIEACLKISRDDVFREKIAVKGFNLISQHPQAQYTKLVL
jgi:hypothetical protein